MASGSTRVPRLATQRFSKSASCRDQPKECCGIQAQVPIPLAGIDADTASGVTPCVSSFPTVGNLRAVLKLL